MPFDDVYQDMFERVSLGGRECFFPTNSMPTGGGAPGGCYPNYIPTQIVRSGYDLKTEPHNFPETLHVGLKSDCKNNDIGVIPEFFQKVGQKRKKWVKIDLFFNFFIFESPYLGTRWP